MSAATGTAARASAARVVSDVLDRGQSFDAAFAAAATKGGEARDRAFARALASTSLRRLGRIDAVLKPYLKRPLPKSAGYARALLRVGAAQLLFLQTPPHAAVGETTGAADALPKCKRFKGLINAVLRRVAADGPARLEAMSPSDDWPDWLVRAWRKDYGGDDAALIAQACGAEAPLDITVKSEPQAWAERLGGAVTPLGSVRLTGHGDVSALDGFADGEWWVQDAAASLPARLLGDVAGKRVADLCAAPGGKTMQLAAAGAEVTALDHSPERLERLAENLQRTKLSAQIVAADLRDFAEDVSEPPFDAVLLDAPCSATGTLRRHPDAAWLRTARAPKELAVLQHALLEAAARLAKPGAPIIYCTCSLLKAEGEAVVEAVTQARSDLVLDPITSDEAPGAPRDAITGPGWVRTRPDFWPDIGGMDGFFAARLRRA